MTYLPDLPPEPVPPAPGGDASGGAASGGTIVEPRRRGAGRLLPFLAGLAVMLAAILVFNALRPAAPQLTRTDVAQAIASALASQTPPPPASELVYQAVAPSIVLIETAGTAADGNPSAGEGTGVVVSSQGEILTALHVVADAASVTLTFADGSKSPGTIVSQDVAKDIAVISPDNPPATIAAATLGNPGSMRIGSEAYIVGNPFGLVGSLSAGVVSGLDRAFRDPATDQVRDGLIQVDAAVNPGNSGGPLLDRGGRVVGIVTALINPTKQDVFIGIGLAVPIDVAGGAAGLPPY